MDEEWTPPTYSGLSNSLNIIQTLEKDGEGGMPPEAIPESERCRISTAYRAFQPSLDRKSPQTVKETVAEGERSPPAPRVILAGPLTMNLPPGHMSDAQKWSLVPRRPSPARNDITSRQSQVPLGDDETSGVASHSPKGAPFAGPSVALAAVSPQVMQMEKFPASRQSPGPHFPSSCGWSELAADRTKPSSPSEGEPRRGKAEVEAQASAATSVVYTPCPPARRRSNHKRWRRWSSKEQRRSLSFSDNVLGPIDGCFEKPAMVTSSGGDTSTGNMHGIANAISADSLIGLSIASSGGVCLQPRVGQAALEGPVQDSPGTNVRASGPPFGSVECRDGDGIHEGEGIKEDRHGEDAKDEAKGRTDEKARNAHESQTVIQLGGIEGGETFLDPSIVHVETPTIQSPAPSSVPGSGLQTSVGAARTLFPVRSEMKEMKGLFHHQRQEDAKEDAVPIDSGGGGSSDTHERREGLGNQRSQPVNDEEAVLGETERRRERVGETGSQEENMRAEGSVGKSEQSLSALQRARENLTVSCIEAPSRRYSDLVALGQETGKGITTLEEPGHSDSVVIIRGGETGQTPSATKHK